MAAISPESFPASGKAAERLSLPKLQSRMKEDPEGYEAELLQIYRHFESTLDLFRHDLALDQSPDPVVFKYLGDRTMFLANMAPYYPLRLAELPRKVLDLLETYARKLPSSLRCQLTRAIIILVNRKIVELEVPLELFMDLQIIGDRTLRKLAFSHVVDSIQYMNKKSKKEAYNKKLQNIFFKLLQGDEELIARRSLAVLCKLFRRKVWFDDRTINAICNACFHSSSRVMVAVISFLLGFKHNEHDADDSEVSSNDDDVQHKATASNKKKKRAKLQRIVHNKKKRQQRRLSENSGLNSYSPLSLLNDAQGFAEKLFSHLQTCNEKYEVRMMMLKVIAKTIGLHYLVLLNFYPYFQRYVEPHQPDVTNLLAAGIQACHDMVPPDAVEPLFKQIVNQFVFNRSRPEAITVGLNAVREMCLRMPLLMNEDLLQDLDLYKKSHKKAVSNAARSLITLFREICPSLMIKKDRGRPIDSKARPKASEDYEEMDAELNELHTSSTDEHDGDNGEDSSLDGDKSDIEKVEDELRTKKRKLEDRFENLNPADASLRTLKRLLAIKTAKASNDGADGFLSNEGFIRIKEPKARKEAKRALYQHGLLRKDADSTSTTFKIPSSEQLSTKRLDPAKFETGGPSKRQKQHKKAMPARSRQEKKKQKKRAGKKFKGRKACK